MERYIYIIQQIFPFLKNMFTKESDLSKKGKDDVYISIILFDEGSYTDSSMPACALTRLAAWKVATVYAAVVVVLNPHLNLIFERRFLIFKICLITGDVKHLQENLCFRIIIIIFVEHYFATVCNFLVFNVYFVNSS